MKKAISILLATVLCLSLCSCAKSEEALAVEELINGIGTVTLESNEAIAAVEAAYEALTPDQKEEVENYTALTDARKLYNELVAKDAAAEIDALIDKIGTVSLDKETSVSDAKLAYDAASEEVKAFVAKADTLNAATAEIARLKGEKLQAEANSVIALIQKIGTVTLESGTTITTARDAYNKLSAEAKALVTNADVLSNAAKSYKEKCVAEANALLKGMKLDSDVVRNMKFYYPSAFPYYTNYWGADIRCFSLPYIGMQGDDVWLRWVCNYTDDDWVFFEKITFAVDSARYNKFFSYSNVTRDNDGGEVWEYVDIDVGSSELNILRAIANSSTTIIRFEGDEYYRDFTVSAKDKQAIKQALIVYDAYTFSVS